MVKKSSFFDKLKHRWKSGSGVRAERAPVGVGRGQPLESRLDRQPDPGGSLALPDGQPVSGRKLSAREEAVVAMGEGFRELSTLLRGVQTRMEDQSGRTNALAQDAAVLPGLGRSQLALLQQIARHFERQNEVGDKLLQTLSPLPDLLGGVREALAKATATDERTATTLDQFRATMGRIEGSMQRMVESSSAQAAAAADLVRERQGEGDRVVQALAEGRDALVASQRQGVERLEAATGKRLDAMRALQDEQSARLGKLIADNGRWTQLLVVLLSLTFFAITGILAVLALK